MTLWRQVARKYRAIINAQKRQAVKDAAAREVLTWARGLRTAKEYRFTGREDDISLFIDGNEHKGWYSGVIRRLAREGRIGVTSCEGWQPFQHGEFRRIEIIAVDGNV